MTIPLKTHTVPFGRILHLGLGAFHRSHQAVYLQRLKQQGERSWLLAATNIRNDSSALIDALARQGGYTLETVDPDGRTRYEWINAIDQVIPWEEDLATATALAADPLTRIISFTVTESGYGLLPDNTLNAHSAELHDDLARLRRGQAGHTLYGALIGMLRARIRAGSGPLTLQCCDSMRHNGERFQAGLRAFAQRCNAHDVLAWLDTHASFPNSLLDRITPRSTASLRQRVRHATGRHDRAPVSAESYCAWVIQDCFIAGRPPWEDAGALLVASVEPYQEAISRLMKATHCCIAWAGTLRGHTYIHEGAHDPVVRQLVRNFTSEDVFPCLARPDNPVDLDTYREQVLQRFCIVAMQDTNQRVAANAFTKIPACILPTVRDRLAQNASIDAVAMLPALFLVFLERWHNSKLPYLWHDRLMDPSIGHAIASADDPVAALCAQPLLWADLAGHPRLIAAVRRAVERVEREVVRPGRPETASKPSQPACC